MYWPFGLPFVAVIDPIDIRHRPDRSGRMRDWPLCPTRSVEDGALCRRVYPHDGPHDWDRP